jgi:hypothetical protein
MSSEPAERLIRVPSPTRSSSEAVAKADERRAPFRLNDRLAKAPFNERSEVRIRGLFWLTCMEA